MRKLISILFLIPLFSFSQLDIVGDFLITDNMATQIAPRFATPASNFPDNDSDFSNDNATLNTAAETFRTDMSGVGTDTGLWDFFDSDDNEIDATGAVSTEPFPSNFAVSGANRNIHAAAIKARVTNDATLALYVFTALHQRAQDDKLDPSNGGSERGGGEPTRTNSTFGTTARWNRTPAEGYATFTTNPFFIAASKMEQYLISYGLVVDLISSETYYTTNKEYVNYWFKDFAEFFKGNMDVKLNYWLGSNWRNFAQDYNYGTLIGSENNVYYNSGATVQYNVNDGILQGLNNRNWDITAYLGAYGNYFNDSVYKSFHYDFFKATMALGMAPDYTWNEGYRNHDGSGTFYGTVDYTMATFTHIMSGAHQNEVGVTKGYLPSGDAGKYYDYTTAIGSDELFVTYNATSTSGAGKGIYNALITMSKYYRTSANGGFKGDRYDQSATSINIDGSPFNLPIAVANLYYEDADLTDWINWESADGYPAASPSTGANGTSPHSLGISWDMGAALGGMTAMGNITSAFSVPSSPTVTPISSTGILMSRRR